MTFIDPALVLQGARIVVRQAVETAATTALSSTFNPSPTPDISSSESTETPTLQILTTPSSTTSALSEATSSPSSNPPPQGNNNSSPLLFFVALGFGVVFTNLWIIVGVKYCFRYNARNRQMRMNEDGEPINMENMPRPRRRREKKLMTIDEVNEKFPMLKYKTWVASRAQEGLPTRGGVSSPSRPNSVRDVDGVISELPNKERMSTEDRPTTSATAPAAETIAKTESITSPGSMTVQTEKPERQHMSKESTSSSIGGAQPRRSTDGARDGSQDGDRDVDSGTLHKASTQGAHDDDEEEDDEHIDAALPPECMGTSGDTCAICIDTLEDDDDVRGLTCGHAFHAVCLDPWLTSRRACCPLCKADYYTPKHRPPGAEHGDGSTVIAINLVDSRSNRMNMPNRPRRTFFGLLGSSESRNEREMYANHRNQRDNRNRSSRQRDSRREHRHRAPTTTAPAPTPESQATSGGWFSGVRTAIAAFPRGRRQNTDNQTTPTASGANPTATPSQLEAGVQRP